MEAARRYLSAGLFGLISACTGPADPPPPPAKRLALANDSAPLLGLKVPGVMLEMSLGELRRLRPRVKRQPAADRERLTVYEEQLRDGQRALYFFGGPAERLARVQVASQLPQVDAIVERVLDLQQRLGATSGVWDCPATHGQVPTRRYSFQRGQAAAAEVFAIIGEHALATFYVTSSKQLRDSLELAECRPISPGSASRFPAVPLP